MEDCLMNLNKGEDDFGGGNILQYSEWNDMVEGINTEELFREYSALWQQEYKSPIARILNTFVGGPINLQLLDFNLSSLQVNPALLTKLGN